MAATLTQAGRLLELKTPLGPDVLCIDRGTMTERVSRLFTLQMDVLADLPKADRVQPPQLLGKGVTLTVRLPEDQKRHFHGMVSRFTVIGRDERHAYFRMEVVPWLWLLTLSSDCKVFQDQTVPEILKAIFQEWQGKYPDLVAFEDKLEGSYKKLDYCVQYRETDFNFVSRLMEEEGIYYFFRHEEGKHTLVLGDTPSAFPPCPHQAQARLEHEAGIGEREDVVQHWEYRQSVVPGKYVLGDYHFQMSNKVLRSTATGSVQVAGNDQLEMFDVGDYAERFNKPDERLGEVEPQGDAMAQWRMEEHAAEHLLIGGESTCRAFSPGLHFALLGAGGSPLTIPGTQGKYVLLSVQHTFEQSPEYVSGESVPQPYKNSFTCIPLGVPYRPPRVTQRPVAQGLQSAVVVGLDGEEIDCDKYGRVKVQFPWDREGQKNERSSCWVRCATLWAGKQWGMIHIPRIGQEVLVAFLEGDPDQPLIVGSVYNYENMPPYKLPDHKTQSGIKTRSSKKGSDQNYNEIRFEDKKGEEQVYIHAEKNLDTVVENDETHSVGFEKKGKGDQTVKIFNNQTLEVGTAQSSEGSQKVKIWKDRDVTLQTGDDRLTIEKGNQYLTLWEGVQMVRINKVRTVKVKEHDILVIEKGNQRVVVEEGSSRTEAMQSIELKVGQSSVTIDQSGVTIKGLMVKIEGQTMTQVKGTMTDVNGSGMLKLAGGVTMLG
jgi:type VI secretion system secreted protein VgrG